MLRCSLVAVLAAALLSVACTGDPAATDRPDPGGDTSSVPLPTVPSGEPLPDDRMLVDGVLYDYPWVPWANVLTDLDDQNWRIEEVYVESPVPVGWVNEGSLQARIQLTAANRLDLLSPEGIVATFRPTTEQGVGSDTVLTGRLLDDDHPWRVGIGAGCPDQRPEADNLLGIGARFLDRLQAAEAFVLLDGRGQWTPGGPAAPYYGTAVEVSGDVVTAGSPPALDALSADPRVAEAVAARLSDGLEVVVALDDDGPVLFAAAIDGDRFEPLVGCDAYHSTVEMWRAWHDHDTNRQRGHEDPPTAGLAPAAALLSLTGIEPAGEATLDAMAAWADGPEGEVAWEDRDPRYRWADPGSVPPDIWEGTEQVNVELTVPPGWRPTVEGVPLLCLWTPLGWSSNGCGGSVDDNNWTSTRGAFLPGDPVEVAFLPEGGPTDDPVVLAVLEDVRPGETFHLQITGNPTLDDLRARPDDYVRFTCCRPGYGDG